MKCFENRNFIAKFCKIACTGKTCRARTDNRYFMSICLFSFLRLDTVFASPVCYKTFQFTDGNWFAFETTDTFSFALAFLWTNTTTNCWKCTRLRDNLIRSFKVSIFYFLDKCWNVDRNRTSLHTKCIFTIQTTFCFCYCFFFVVTVTYFFKILCTFLCVLFTNRYSL